MVYGVLEELPTGIWILSPDGTTVSINRYAHRLCRLLFKSGTRAEMRHEAGSSETPDSGSCLFSRSTEEAALSPQQLPVEPGEQSLLMPQAVQRLYQAVIESRDLFPDRPMIIEDKVQLGSLTVHLRARWLELELDSYVLVMLESPQIHPLARLSKLIHRGSVRRPKQKWGNQAESEQFLEHLG